MCRAAPLKAKQVSGLKARRLANAGGTAEACLSSPMWTEGNFFAVFPPEFCNFIQQKENFIL